MILHVRLFRPHAIYMAIRRSSGEHVFLACGTCLEYRTLTLLSRRSTYVGPSPDGWRLCLWRPMSQILECLLLWCISHLGMLKAKALICKLGGQLVPASISRQSACVCFCSYHQYKFIVDGEWRHDETQPFMPDPLGNVNNWLFVRRPEQSQNQG